MVLCTGSTERFSMLAVLRCCMCRKAHCSLVLVNKCCTYAGEYALRSISMPLYLRTHGDRSSMPSLTANMRRFAQGPVTTLQGRFALHSLRAAPVSACRSMSGGSCSCHTQSAYLRKAAAWTRCAGSVCWRATEERGHGPGRSSAPTVESSRRNSIDFMSITDASVCACTNEVVHTRAPARRRTAALDNHFVPRRIRLRATLQWRRAPPEAVAPKLRCCSSSVYPPCCHIVCNALPKELLEAAMTHLEAAMG
eukprot:6490912-Amphidinium_carterae.1